jgi:hypothetical protein
VHHLADGTSARRRCTTTLFAALNVLKGTVIGRCMQRHRHQESQHPAESPKRGFRQVHTTRRFSIGVMK